MSSPHFSEKTALDQISLRLYIAKGTSSSKMALKDLEYFCNEHLKKGYEIEIIDIQEEPQRAEADKIYVTPTLIKTSPLPYRKLIGDFSKTKEMLKALDLT